MTTENSNTVKMTTLIIVIFISITGTFLSLEMNGLINHTKSKQELPIANYKAVFIDNLDDKQYRLSYKPSNQTAICHDGYLFISSDTDQHFQGLLVDYKNRGVRCEH